MNEELSLPTMGRQVSIAIGKMRNDLALEEEGEEDEDEDDEDVSRNPSDLINCSMSCAPPKLTKTKRKAVFFNPLLVEEEGDLVMSQHTISDSNPYENKRCATLVREITQGTPPQAEEK
jgi:hypothetical protein